MPGNLPPGCMQAEIDRAHGYLDEPPQQWFTCDECDGAGEIVTGHWGYEPGCSHGHMMDHGSPCDRCGGEGGWIGDVEHDGC